MTVLSFVTLTYANNMKNVKLISLFFKRLKKWWNNPKRAKYLDELKYLYVYEYQSRGAVHYYDVEISCEGKIIDINSAGLDKLDNILKQKDKLKNKDKK